MAQRYASSGLPEAQAFRGRPCWGPGLCCALASWSICPRRRGHVLGPIDAQLWSSMTLFARTAPREPLFQELPVHHFGGESDDATTSRL